MKKINIILIFVLTLLAFFTSSCWKRNLQDYEETYEEITPIFYKITNSKTDNTIYLLGSIHAADDSIYPLNDVIMNAFNESDYLAVELDIVALTSNFSAQVEFTKKLMYTNGITIKEELGDELYNKVIEKLKQKKSYNSIYDNYKPALFESLFENIIIKDAGMDSNQGIDIHFLNLAKNQEKEILEIETPEFQYNILLSTPIELNKQTLNSYVENYEDAVLDMKNLYNAWKKGDISFLEQSLYIDTDNMSQEEISVLNDYNNALVIDRNYGMVKTLERYFDNNKNVFCVVGIGHVVGDEGIISLLKKKGYTIEKISYDKD